MSGTLKEINSLEQTIEAAGYRGVNAQMVLDLLRSLAKVGGTLNQKDGTSPVSDQTLASGWNPINIWEASRDTQGVKDMLDTAEGAFLVKSNGGGDYTINAKVRFVADQAGTYDLRAEVVEIDGTSTRFTLYQDSVDIDAGGQGLLIIAGGLIKDCVKDEKLRLAMRGPNGAEVTFQFGQFNIER